MMLFELHESNEVTKINNNLFPTPKIKLQTDSEIINPLILDTTPKNDLIVIAGDLNAHVGSERLGWEATLGCFGHGEINDNGLRLLSFAVANNMVIGNSIFQHPLKHRRHLEKSEW
ncbi:endonuclease exonuclease phosphatase family [Labeo rohita]|uniref:Endonuclease exonuclease phosphatase family n=1 Tax=Labeo rohita TaxID=84645 RepID=A0A498MF27_LABRO|nr:endonuclease exonuclease phosphatase family [Labeo rohita]